MNRHQRRASRIKDPKGNYLYPQLLHVIEYDEKGRPTVCRIGYDEETLGDVIGDDGRPVMLLVWMGERQGSLS